MDVKIPKEIQEIGGIIIDAGFEAYIVGGCVRDLLLGREPQDWDITTNAGPEDIQGLFGNHFYENKFGTVTVVTQSKKKSLQHIEITPYRSEAGYTDRRHPDIIEFAHRLDQDLKRRDFTVNAMAINLEPQNRKLETEKSDDSRSKCKVSSFEVIDLFGGEKDLKDQLIRTVGSPDDRFGEDALRLMRAIRLATVLDFDIEIKTAESIANHASLLASVSTERIRDELSKLMLCKEPERGFEIMRELNVLPHVMSELLEGHHVGQNKHHVYTVWEHNLRALRCAADNNWPLEVRMAALLHDVAKPRCKSGDGPDSTFYGHDVVGAKMTLKILDRLRFPRQFIEKTAKLVRYHLFYYNVGEVTESSVRRLIAHVGVEDMEDLIRVRVCDRIGSGVPKAEPYKLRHFRFLVEKLSRDPVSVRMLRIRGDEVMKIANIEPGPKIGFLLNILLEEVLDDPNLNRKTYLEQRIKKLAGMSEDELNQLADDARKKAVAIEESAVGEIKKRHWIR